MSDTAYAQVLNLICGGLLLSAVLMVWRRELAAIVRLLAAQGVLLAALALLLGIRENSNELYAVAAGVLVLKAVVLPAVLRRVLRETGEGRDAERRAGATGDRPAEAVWTRVFENDKLGQVAVGRIERFHRSVAAGIIHHDDFVRNAPHAQFQMQMFDCRGNASLFVPCGNDN